MPSKAQGLSLNTIVIAAIVLVVLLILVGMTTGYFGGWIPKFNLASSTSCSEKGGTPTTGDCPFGKNQEASGFFEDVKEGQKCCLKLCAELDGICKVAGCPSGERITSGDWICGSNPCCKLI